MPRQTKKLVASQWFKQPTMVQDTFLFSINQQFWKAIADFGITLPNRYSALGHIDRDVLTVTDTYSTNGYEIAVAHGEKQDLVAGIKFGAIDDKDFKFVESNPLLFVNYNNPLREDGDVGGDLWKLLLGEYGMGYDATFVDVLIYAVQGFGAYRDFLQFLGGESGLLPRSCMVRTWANLKIEYRVFKVTGEVFDDSSWFVKSDTNPSVAQLEFKDTLDRVQWLHRT